MAISRPDRFELQLMSSPANESAAPRICLFGRPAAYRGRSALAFPEKGFLLVALLAFAPGNALDRDALRDLLWEGVSAERRSGNLRQLLLRLGRLDGAASPVAGTPDGRLRLATNLWRIDATDLMQATPADVEARSLATDPLLEGVEASGEAFEEWLGEARRNVNERRSAILRAALEGRELSVAEKIGLAGKLIACDPFDETGYRGLMAAHAESGDARTARRWWLECRKRLNEHFGVAPSSETRMLASRLGLEETAAPVAAMPVARETVREQAFGIPSVVVMPPTLIAGNELLDSLGLVVLEEITLGLSQFGSFRVIAAHTSWQLSRRKQSLQDFDDTRFDYAVTIGVKNFHGPLGVTCRLTKLSTGEVLWTVEREVSAANLQGSLNELVRKTVHSLAAALERAEGRGTASEPGSTGYRMYLEGKRSVGATGLEPLRSARKWFKAAVKRCDEFSAAFAGLSRTLSMEWLVRGMTERELLSEALAAAQRAQACDPGSGRAIRELGFTNLYLRRHDDSLAHFAEARALAPHDADLLADYADALMHDGQAEKALELVKAAKALNPLGPDYYRWIEATVLYSLEGYEEAIEVLRPLGESPATARLMAASTAMAGDISAAQIHAAKVREHYPDFRVEQIWGIVPDRHRSDTAHFIQGLQLAGLP